MKRAPYSFAPDLTGKSFWRSLGELAGSPSFKAAQEREFPEGASEAPDGMGRRRFLGIMGASLALGGLAACRRPEELIVPYSRAPEEVVPGKPLFFATAVPFMGTAFGLLVESHEGRPTKIEGNPRHPESLGSTNAFLQGMVLDLYDPDRSETPMEHGEHRSWDEAAAFLRRTGEALAERRGRGLAVLTGAHRSPTLQRLLGELKEKMPEASVVRWDPCSRAAAREGARLCFGEALDPLLDLERARVIVTLDADILHHDGSAVRQARGFAAGRSSEARNRLYSVESAYSLTGANADHRLRMQSRRVARFFAQVAHELGLDVPAPGDLGDRELRHARAIAADLAANRGAGLVVAGSHQPPQLHALVHLVNDALGNTGKTVRYVAPFDASPEGPESIAALAEAMHRGTIDTLIILDQNPVFDAPADARFGEALGKVKLSIALATHADETSHKTTWHLNRAHPLEAWSDVRAEDGTASVAQPLIAPLYGGRTDAEVLDLLLGRGRKAYAIVEETWQAARGGIGFDFTKTLRRALHDGLWADSESKAVSPRPRAGALAEALRGLPASGEGIEITFRPDPHAWDGRFANNGWLQELPDPMHKLTWGNAAAISATLAKEHGLEDGDVVALSVGGAEIEIPVLIAPGQADSSIALTFGQGRSTVGRVGTGTGTDVSPLRQSHAFGMASGATLRRTGKNVELSRTQEHFAMEGRPLARSGTVEELEKERRKTSHLPILNHWDEKKYPGHAWGMSIDLDACVGCNACTIACQAENNIPIVGAEGVRGTREMHWIRVDRYFEGLDPHEPQSIAQPMACQQCENAPCEEVCPVGATSHRPEGLNDMAYNRCVGTRYCANNCPFKVRRFNFLDYHKGTTELGKMQINPDVSVRARGVMEKCTFCVQRINHAKIDAKREGREHLADGTITTACEQACPTKAITFGDLNDPSSRVAAQAKSPRAYRMLEDLNVRARVSYLARVRNPNPALEGV